MLIRSTSAVKKPAPSHWQWRAAFLRTGTAVAAAIVTAAAAVVIPIPAAQAAPAPDDPSAAHSLRGPVTDENFYFVMADRFSNGNTANDDGGLGPDPMVSGFDPTKKGFYNGGDLNGLLDKIDYIQGLGTTSIWLTPSFKNKAVQPEDKSAGYHGYWVTDFTQIDPHLGTNDELKALIDEAHSRGMKVYFDIITNHTADVIGYQGGRPRRATCPRTPSPTGPPPGSRSMTATTPERAASRPWTRRRPSPTRRCWMPARRTSRSPPGSTTPRSTTTAATPPSQARTPSTATSSAWTTCSPNTPPWSTE